MPSTRTFTRSFAGGEISPEMFGRIDDVKYQSGAATLRNMLTKPQGPAQNRPGFRYVAETGSATFKSRLIPFTFSTTQTLAIEIGSKSAVNFPNQQGNGYARFYSYGQPLLVPTGVSAPPAYIPNQTSTNIDLATDIVTFPTHGLSDGDPVRLTLGSVNPLPSPLVEGKTYYVYAVSTTQLRFFNNRDDALLNTNHIDLTSKVTNGDIKVHYAYTDGDLVTWSGVGPGVYMCTQDYPNENPPTTAAYWYPQPATGQLEVPLPYAAADIFSIHYVQSNDVLTLVHPNYPVGELRRYGTTKWAYTTVSFAASLTPPSNVAAQRTIGVSVRLTRIFNTQFSDNKTYFETVSEHGFAKGDSVLLYDPPWPAKNSKFYVVSEIDTAAPFLEFQLKEYQGGGLIDYTPHITFTGTNATSRVNHVGHGLKDGTKMQFRRNGTGINWPTGLNIYDLSTSNFAYSRNATANDYEIWTAATGGTRITWAAINDGGVLGRFNAEVYPDADALVQYAPSTIFVSNTYKVTAIGADLTESLPSSSVTLINNLNATGALNTISWTAVPGAIRYTVYKEQSGLFGYLGQTEGVSFVDNNIAPDMGATPPIYDTVFASAGNYPGAVTYFEQRRCFAGTTNQPQAIWMTKSATERDMSYSLPTKDNDRILFQVAARESNTIRNLLPMPDMIALTNSAEWRITSVNQDALTPYSISVRPQSYIGSSNVQPVLVNNTAIYAAARGGHVREMGYNWQNSGYVTGDLSLRAAHLFDDYEITDMAYQKSPVPLLWFVSSNGKMLSLTYIPEEQVGAWHWHDTQGTFESCCVIAEGEEDYLYVVVNRGTLAAPVWYVERMASRNFPTLADAYFVDSGITKTGPASVTVNGLGHLNGKVVSILADGKVHPQKVVQGGTVTLNYAASTVHVGLAYTSDIKTLPMVLQTESFGQGVVKNINKAWLRVLQSCPFKIGPSETKLVSSDPYMAAASMANGPVDVMLSPTWDWDGSMLIRQTDPVPLNVISTSVEVAIGGA